jgi:hypothetical protein
MRDHFGASLRPTDAQGLETWHYIDYALKPPTFAFEPQPNPDDDALFGIEESEKTLSDRTAPAEERAVALSWLIHLVGDIHQPLHCASLFTEAYPRGDRGGNEFFVMPASRGIKLHSFWDITKCLKNYRNEVR